MSPLFLLKLEVLKKIKAHGIRLRFWFLLYFCFKCDKMLQEWELSKNGSNVIQGKSFEKFIFVNVGFYETSQVLIFAYT